jgi:ATP-dependent RNA helicase DeaD
MPTQADVAARRVSQLKETIRGNLQEGDLDLYLQLVEQMVEEGPHDIAEIAAAAVRLASTAKPLAVAAPVPPPLPRSPRPESKPQSAEVTKTRISLAVGKRDGIRPADVVGSIANEANVPGRDIGPIDIRDDVTFVMIPSRYVDQVLQKVGRKRFRGRALNVRVATGEPPQSKRPPFGKFMKKPRR